MGRRIAALHTERCGRVWFVSALLLLAATVVPLSAQTRWDFNEVSTSGYDKHNAQVVLDERGNAHMVWGSKDPTYSGLQLFYSNDATGRFTAPVLATDTGSVFDSSHAAISSFVFRMDRQGAAHLAFIANTDNQLRLYYTDNARNEFARSVLVASQVRYDMAVDSAGNAHIIWLGAESGVISLYYWNSVNNQSVLLETLPCDQGGFGCGIGYPEVEVFKGRLTIAFRADSSSIYMTELPSTSGEGLLRIPVPGYDRNRTRLGRADLRLRMALDTLGRAHILAPIYTGATRNRLLYISNGSGYFQINSVTNDTLSAPPSDFDIASNGGDRMVMTWTDTARSVGRPRLAVAEYKGARGVWTQQSLISPLAVTGTAGTANGLRVSTQGATVAISGVYRSATGIQAGLFRRAALRPRISYLHPDAGAAGMNIVVEAIAPYRDRGAFGADGLNLDPVRAEPVVRMELVDRSDSARVVIGPSVVSWDGRVVSTMLFVPPDAKPGGVAVAIRVNGVLSNIDTFHVVVPRSGRLSGGGVIGAGYRSRRGVIVVDSLVLSGGTFTVDTTDTDPQTPGNQGLLPVTILSRGPVRIDSSATLTVSATADVAGITNGSAGPGGGSGGSGGWIGAGPGFTAGGGFGKAFSGETLGESQGSGGTRSARWVGGPALNGAPGGAVYPEAAAGGGTGHPFGASGTFGRISPDEPTVIDVGGYGAGSAGYSAYSLRGTSGGGGGGYGSAGESGNPGNEPENGGFSVGSRQLVPLAGGSGGGGGGFSDRGFVNGGSGGGALQLISYAGIRIDGQVRADGAAGMSGHAANASGGGGGAGGGLLLAAKEGVIFGARSRISAAGGTGGKGFSAAERVGGGGGAGRIRIDGASGRSFPQVVPSPGYSGPATVASRLVTPRAGERITGYGEPGSRIRIFVRPAGGSWNYRSPVDTVVLANGTWGVRLPANLGNGPVNIVAMQATANPSRSDFGYEPDWVMSPASGNAIGLPGIRHAGSIPERPCIRFDERDTIDYVVENTSSLAMLTIDNARITGENSDRFSVTPSSLQIPPKEKGHFRIIFEPRAPGVYKSTAFEFDADAVDASTSKIPLAGCAVTGRISTDSATMSLGSICRGATIDTTVVIHNTGTGTLRLTSVTSNDGVLRTDVLGRALPRTIAVGGRDTLRLRFTANGFASSGSTVIFGSDAYDPIDSITIYYSNGQPSPDIPSTIGFAPVDRHRGQECVETTVTISNWSATEPMTLRRITLNHPNFSIVDAPAADTTLAPLGSVRIRLKFCPDSDREFVASLPLRFLGGSCDLDTSITLQGATLFASKIELISSREHRFAPVLPNTRTAPTEILIVNNGNIADTLDEPVLAPAPGTLASEIRIMKPAGWPYLDAGDTMAIGVVMIPNGTGERSATIGLRTLDGAWNDSVVVIGMGTTVMGISVSPDSLGFGASRVGSLSQEKELVVSNSGNVSETIVGFEFSRATPFECLDCAAGLPAIEIAPGTAGEKRFHLVYKPTTIGRDVDSVTIVFASSTRLTVALAGAGVLERIAADPIDFGCLPAGADSTISVIVRNEGTAPLVIFGHSIEGTAFSISAMIQPDTIAPDADRAYPVRYRSSTGRSSGTITFVNSTGTDLKVPLEGMDCTSERTLSLALPDTMSADIGSVFYLPVLAEMSEPTDRDVSYELKLTFEPGLLLPFDSLDHAGNPDAQPRTEGMLGGSAGMHEEKLGELIVRGTIPAGRRGDTLVALPMRVLLSSVNSTDVVITSLTFGATSGVKAGRLGNGVFVATDCDTSRHIITGAGKYMLSQNYPNPSPAGTRIEFRVPYAERTTITLYDETGTFLRTLVDQVNEPGVLYRLELDRSDLHSGTYYYEMQSGYTRILRRMVVVE